MHLPKSPGRDDFNERHGAAVSSSTSRVVGNSVGCFERPRLAEAVAAGRTNSRAPLWRLMDAQRRSEGLTRLSPTSKRGNGFTACRLEIASQQPKLCAFTLRRTAPNRFVICGARLNPQLTFKLWRMQFGDTLIENRYDPRSSAVPSRSA
jgi:hypothetical protein